ncbi:MAG TPA: MopE-related protein [Candidatus Polarisedimenticolaceae bacterium]|nr:MopE-related protein [Candidatus Polarisedimenticolaceae bacterium]
MRLVALSVIAVGFSSSFSSASSPRALTIEERVAAQRAIEDVYARHRVGADGAAVPDAVIRSKVDRFLRESAALDLMWDTRIGADAVERELARISRESLRPDILSDLFRALDSDPNKVADVLVRPIIVDRLARTSYAWDPRIHGGLRRQAEQSLRVSKSLDALSRIAPRWETKTVEASSDEARLTAKVEETETSFTVRGVVSRDRDKAVVGTATWDKEPFESWLDRTQTVEPAEPLTSAASLPALSGGCTADEWSRLPSPPDIMGDTLYGWTGTELIVWSPARRYGGRYDAALDSWSSMNTVGTTARTLGPTGVWAGGVFIVWGGVDPNSSVRLNTGEKYDPQTDTWSPMTTVGAPAGRTGHVAVWTGSRMIVWAGVPSSGPANTGGSYDPQTNTWSPISGAGTTVPRSAGTAVWDGTRMIVFGGYDASGVNPLGTGARYDPSTDTWSATNPLNAPSARREHSAIWTGSEMIVWGGRDTAAAILNTGARYNPVTDTWTPTTQTNAAIQRYLHTAVWTGTEMLLWGGWNYSGGRYNPSTDSWLPMNNPGIPVIGHHGHAAAWTGSAMVIWGGVEAAAVRTGGRYDPVINSWTPTHTYGEPSARHSAKSVWTGTELLVWGGFGGGGEPVAGARLDLATSTWSPMSTVAAPAGRANPTMVWTGREAIVWGGSSGGSPVNSGGVYDPVSDAWRQTAFPPLTARAGHGAVWTGKRMLVWGGDNSIAANQPETGALYDPVTNIWTSTSTVNSPTKRIGNMLVWTGSRAIAWASGTTPGGLYDPETNSWTVMSMTGQPPTGGLSVWTGSKMFVWSAGDGGRYDPVTNTWSSAATVGAVPSPVSLVWTGDRAFAWNASNVGGYYDPVADAWSPAPVDAAPSSRSLYAASWVGTSVALWGGIATGSSSSYLATGGALCQACATTFTYYRDNDGDGDGVPGVSVQGCSAIAPVGWGITSTDCDDANPAIYSGASQLCDGINNNCSDPNWPTVPAVEANADGDVFRICAGDCNDANATVFPGATQLCDGINNNCSDASWPTPPANEADADGDGFRICANDCNDTNAQINPLRLDVCDGIDNDCSGQFDDDGFGVDTDSDGFRNACDNCRLIANPQQTDTDGDLVGNACDNCVAAPNPIQNDSDGDGRGNVCDNCVTIPNVNQDDFDVDRVGDACDNCLFDYNPAQSNRDFDGEGDRCDLNDGLIYVFATDRNYVEWQEESGPTTWNVYEGDLSVLRTTGAYTQVPGSNPLAQKSCGVSDPYVSDLEAVPLGAVKFSLVTGVTGGVEGSLGTSSAGGPRANTNPCP